jgi:hypothetical protein
LVKNSLADKIRQVFAIGTFRPTEIGRFLPTQNGRFLPTLTPLKIPIFKCHFRILVITHYHDFVDFIDFLSYYFMEKTVLREFESHPLRRKSGMPMRHSFSIFSRGFERLV